MITPFSNEQEFKKKFPAEKRKEIQKAIEAVEAFLPKDTHSPWPRKLRMVKGAYGFTRLIAWDGTRGASLSLGYPMDPFLKNYEKFAGMSEEQKTLYQAIGRLNSNREPTEIPAERLRDRIERHGFHITTTLRTQDADIKFQTQDLMKLLHLPQRYLVNTLRLVSGENIGMLTLETFDAWPVNVHILAKEEYHAD